MINNYGTHICIGNESGGIYIKIEESKKFTDEDRLLLNKEYATFLEKLAKYFRKKGKDGK